MYNKIVFEDGQTFTADDANQIQDQYDEAVNDMDERQADFALSLYNETFEGDGVTTSYVVSNTIIAQPIVAVKRLSDSTYVAETISEDTTTDWTYTNGTDTITQNTSSATLVAGEYVRFGYILQILPHASTHSIGGSDEININDIDGYTQAEVQALIDSASGGVTESRAYEIAEEVKSDSTVAAVCRTVSDSALVSPGEIAVVST